MGIFNIILGLVANFFRRMTIIINAQTSNIDLYYVLNEKGTGRPTCTHDRACFDGSVAL